MFAVFDDGKAFGDFACLLVVLDGIALFDFIGDDLLYKVWVDVLDTGLVGVGVDGYFCGYGRFANGEFEELACEGAESYAQHLCEAVPVERVAALGDVCDFSVTCGASDDFAVFESDIGIAFGEVAVKPLGEEVFVFIGDVGRLKSAEFACSYGGAKGLEIGRMGDCLALIQAGENDIIPN